MYTVYQMPDGRLTVIPVGSQPPAGGVAIIGPVSSAEASGYLNSQGQGVSPEGVSMTQTGSGSANPYNPTATSASDVGVDWSAEQVARQQREAQQRAARLGQQGVDKISQSMGAASDYGQNIATGGMDPYKYDNIRTGKLGETTPTPTGVTASQFQQDVFNTNPSGTSGGYNAADPLNPAGYQSGGDWMAGSDPGMLDYTGMLAGGPQYTTEQLDDPALMTERWLQSTTGDTFHANKGMLRDAYGSYDTLYGIQNGGATIANPATAASMAGDWMTNFNGSTGGRSVDVNGLWDQTMGGYGDFAQGMSANADSSGQAQFAMVTDALGALAPFMNPQAASIIDAQINNAWLQYNSMGANPSMSFIDYLRSIGAADWI